MSNKEFYLNLVEIGRVKLTLFHRPSKDKHIPFFPSIGKKEPQTTILTCSEFCDRITRIRAKLIRSKPDQ